MDRILERFALEDLERVTDLVGSMHERISTVFKPTPQELWERRLIAKYVKERVKSALAEHPDRQGDWSNCVSALDKILLENFTKQSLGSDLSVIDQRSVKYHDYVSAMVNGERRTYMGLHTRPFDDDGMSVVVAYKPTLHEQPYHAHRITDENSLALNPTMGLALMGNGVPAELLEMNPGDMVRFAVGTPHTLKNPTNLMSADISVKLPTALGDRVPLSHLSIGDYIDTQDPSKFLGELRRPNIQLTPGARKHLRYDVVESQRRYRVDYLEIEPGKRVEHFDIDGIAQDTVGMMSVFSDQKDDARTSIAVEGHDGLIKNINLGDWLAVSEKFKQGLSLSNDSETDATVYFAREV